MYFSNSNSGILGNQCRQDRWVENMDLDDRLETGIVFYEGNRSVRKDFAKAARYFNGSLKAGNFEANYYLGMLYRTGSEVQLCNETTFHFFERGMRAKDPKSMIELSECYLLGVGVDVNDLIAVEYTKLAADAGDPKGMYWRGLQKMYGRMTERNFITARRLSEKAVEKGYQNAKLIFAMYYHRRLGVERDVARAIKL